MHDWPDELLAELLTHAEQSIKARHMLAGIRKAQSVFYLIMEASSSHLYSNIID